MNSFSTGVAAVALAFALTVPPARAAGDLLVAPTRVILDGARGTEVILNNVGSAPATYRISLELRRMKADGSVEDVALDQANEKERAILAMLTYAPRRIVLPPNQPQAIRIGARVGADLPDGEYRAHMLFRAIPEAKPATAVEAREGLSIALTPIYGVTIPIIVRKGALKVTAAIAGARLAQTAEGPALAVDLSRTGERSTFGRLRISKGGKAVFEAGGIAVYPELGSRTVTLPLPSEIAASLAGPVKIEYLEDVSIGGGTIAALETVIR